ncbi:hypothetical protein SteCoe_22755 [Stentor coeruleus]|uniref:Uncharacterized protein n=1 Tax=Stentor coeruleus TaxID=5963 RepID=A0A1R2BLH3_9CILI|nr:hypothetical protein SteCoe_22755 [Stentor coeruleus]
MKVSQSGTPPLSTCSKLQLLSELESETKTQEKKHEENIKHIKFQISLLKQELKDMENSYEQNLSNNKTSYENLIQNEKSSLNPLITGLQSHLQDLKTSLKYFHQQSLELQTANSKIRSTCKEELEILSNKKKNLLAVHEELDRKIQEIQNHKTIVLKSTLKDSKTKHKDEKIQIRERINTERKGKQSEIEHKTELMHKLEISVNKMKGELDALMWNNKKQIFELNKKIQETESQMDQYSFNMKKTMQSSKNRLMNNGEIEEIAFGKTKEIEEMTEVNCFLRAKAERLNKIIFGKTQVG